MPRASISLSGYSLAQVTRLVSRWMSGQQTLAKTPDSSEGS